MKNYLLLFFFLLGSAGFAAAQHTLSGQVVSAASRQPLPWASLHLKGRAAGVSADDSGRFRLTLPDSAVTLQVSFIGYESRELVLSPPYGQPLVLALQPVQGQLQEVVVSTGYQQLPRERATGSRGRWTGNGSGSRPAPAYSAAWNPWPTASPWTAPPARDA